MRRGRDDRHAPRRRRAAPRPSRARSSPPPTTRQRRPRQPQAGDVERHREHVAHAGLVADAAAELADALLAGVCLGGCHPRQLRDGARPRSVAATFAPPTRLAQCAARATPVHQPGRRRAPLRARGAGGLGRPDRVGQGVGQGRERDLGRQRRRHLPPSARSRQPPRRSRRRSRAACSPSPMCSRAPDRPSPSRTPSRRRWGPRCASPRAGACSRCARACSPRRRRRRPRPGRASRPNRG